MKTVQKIQRELRGRRDPERAKASLWFFKTGKGEYGEGDSFLGLTMSEQRKIARHFFRFTSLDETLQLLRTGKFHEERMVALLMMLMKFKEGSLPEQKKIYHAYLKNTEYINNWDLVDVTCRDIVGAYLFWRDRKILYKLARSKSLWERRIAIVSTFYFIAKGDLTDTFNIAKLLLSDTHDLIHKAVGWALREAGKKDQLRLETFLKSHIREVPRTTLRYAIEKFPEPKRKQYLSL